MSDAVHLQPSETCLKLQVIHSLWLCPLGLAMHGVGHAALHDWLLTAQGLGWIRKCPKALHELPPPVSAFCPSVSFNGVPDPTVSERASGGVGRVGSLGGAD